MNNTFYTNAFRHGKVIKYTGYKNGKKVSYTVPFAPTLFVPSKEDKTLTLVSWTALDGTPVEPVVFGSMSESTDFIKQYKEHLDWIKRIINIFFDFDDYFNYICKV